MSATVPREALSLAILVSREVCENFLQSLWIVLVTLLLVLPVHLEHVSNQAIVLLAHCVLACVVDSQVDLNC